MMETLWDTFMKLRELDTVWSENLKSKLHCGLILPLFGFNEIKRLYPMYSANVNVPKKTMGKEEASLRDNMKPGRTSPLLFSELLRSNNKPHKVLCI